MQASMLAMGRRHLRSRGGEEAEPLKTLAEVGSPVV